METTSFNPTNWPSNDASATRPLSKGQGLSSESNSDEESSCSTDNELEETEGTESPHTLLETEQKRSNDEHLPTKPAEPDPSECCGSGCTPCVYDTYDRKLAAWEKTMRKLGKEVVGDRQRFKKKFKIQKIIQVSPDSYVYRFEVPNNGQLNLSVGDYLILKASIKNKPKQRKYTPISPVDAVGYFDVLIKIYPNGKVTSGYVKSWEEGDSVEWVGPKGKLNYIPNKYKMLVLLAAGTGIAPMVQIIQEVLNNEEDETRIHLVYSVRTYDDILLKKTLDEFRDFWNYSHLYCFSQESQGRHVIKYGDCVHFGQVDETLIKDQLKGSLPEDVFFFICGTKPYNKDIIQYLHNLCFNTDSYFRF